MEDEYAIIDKDNDVISDINSTSSVNSIDQNEYVMENEAQCLTSKPVEIAEISEIAAIKENATIIPMKSPIVTLTEETDPVESSTKPEINSVNSGS